MIILGIALFLLVLLILGLASVVGSIIGLCVIGKQNFQRKPLVQGILAFLMVMGILMTLIPLGSVGFLFYANTYLDSSFVETEIEIEEPGYPGYRFTADGVVYQLLPLEPDFDYCLEHSEAVFSYKADSLFASPARGNLYRVENDQGFDLIWNECDMLYCPADQTDAVMAYYGSLEDIQWSYICSRWTEEDDWDARDFQPEALAQLPELWASPDEDLFIPEDAPELWIYANVGDEIVASMSFSIALTETDAYLVRREENAPDDHWERLDQYGIPLPEELRDVAEALAAS